MKYKKNTNNKKNIDFEVENQNQIGKNEKNIRFQLVLLIVSNFV